MCDEIIKGGHYINKLKEFRLSKNIKSSEMAKKINISKSYYSEIENGKKNPSFEVLEKFKLNFSNISIDEIFFSELKKE